MAQHPAQPFTEWSWIDMILSMQKNQNRVSEQGIGLGQDDCAVIPLSVENDQIKNDSPSNGQKKYLILTSDAQVEGAHFSSQWSTYYQIGWKGVTSAFSDLAAKGLDQAYMLCNITFPKNFSQDNARDLWQGISDAAEAYGIDIRGGNTASRPDCGAASQADQPAGLSLDFFLIALDARMIPLRCDAQPGDLIIALGELGLARAGLLYFTHIKDFKNPDQQKDQKKLQTCINHFLQPVLPANLCTVMRELSRQKIIHAAMDISDGFIQDLMHILRASNKQAFLYDQTHPTNNPLLQPFIFRPDHIHPEINFIAQMLNLDPIDIVLRGGEDYIPLITIAPRNWSVLQELAQKNEVPVHIMGEIIDKEHSQVHGSSMHQKITTRENKNDLILNMNNQWTGFSHF